MQKVDSLAKRIRRGSGGILDELTRVRTFIKVVQAGSFSAAARDTSSVSSVARQVKSLERELGVRLLNRSTRSLSLTGPGRMFYDRVLPLVNEFDKATTEVSSLQEEVRGLLRVSLRVTAATTVVVPALPSFLAKYPDLQLDVSLTDERSDLIANNIDVALWLGALPNAEIVAKRLSPTRRIVYGSPTYFAKRGVPTSPEGLREHDCLLLPPRHTTRVGASRAMEKWKRYRSAAALSQITGWCCFQPPWRVWVWALLMSGCCATIWQMGNWYAF